jgi:hypothetical protein
MRPFRGVIGWLPLVLFTACVASQTRAPPAGLERVLSQNSILEAKSENLMLEIQ